MRIGNSIFANKPDRLYAKPLKMHQLILGHSGYWAQGSALFCPKADPLVP